MEAHDVALLVLRLTLGVVFLAHGYNHLFGGGRIAGTANWFEGLGLRPGIVHAWIASLTELAVGATLMLGVATPLAAAGAVGTMLVAMITNHVRNGFFIFRPGEGYEYVLVLTGCGCALGGTGAGTLSIDHLLDSNLTAGWTGLAVAVIGGFGGAAALLLTGWRPQAAKIEGVSTDDAA